MPSRRVKILVYFLLSGRLQFWGHLYSSEFIVENLVVNSNIDNVRRNERNPLFHLGDLATRLVTFATVPLRNFPMRRSL